MRALENRCQLRVRIGGNGGRATEHEPMRHRRCVRLNEGRNGIAEVIAYQHKRHAITAAERCPRQGIPVTDGRWAAIKIKTSEDKVEEGLSGLKRLRKKLCESPKAKTRPPEFIAVLVGLCNYAREAEEGIYIVPIRALCQ